MAAPRPRRSRAGAGARPLALTLAPSLALLLLACTARPTLQPAPGARSLQGGEVGARASASGVEVAVRPRAWSGRPPDLEAFMHPLLVSIENGSEHPLRIRYSDFTLDSEKGRSSVALPPHRIDGTAAVTTWEPAFHHSGFHVAPHHAPFYGSHLSPWHHGFAHDPFYHRHHHATWRVPLPTGDMVERALPEGVIDEGGSLSGFVYFDRGAEAQHLTFELELVDATTGETFDRIEIPFVLKRPQRSGT